MTSKKPRKDPLKTPKVWEKARREKMKIYFNELQEVLPFYDPSSPMSRFEILQKSKIYIKDLQDQNQDLLNGGFDEVYKIKMTKLKQRVKELLRRVDQLTDLLKTANIMIPPLDPYPEGSKSEGTFKWMTQHPKKWTEKINLIVPEDKIKNVLTLIKDYKKNSKKFKLKKKHISKHSDKPETAVNSESHVQKTNKKKVLKKNGKVVNFKSKTRKNALSPGSQSPSQFKENQPVDFNLLSNNTTSSKNVTTEQHELSSTAGSKTLFENITCQVTKSQTANSNKVALSQNVILPSVPNVLQPNTFILTNDGSLVQLPILNPSGTVLSQNSNLLAPTAVVKQNTDILTPLVINKPSPVIVLQKPSPQIFQTAQIINASPQVIVSKPNIQILGGASLLTGSSSLTTVKTLSHILSKTPVNKKRIARDSTVTTYVNKIPIPALSKQSYNKKCAPATSPKKETGNIKSKSTSEKPVEMEKDRVTEKENEKESVEKCSQPQNKKNVDTQISERTEAEVEQGIASESAEKRSLTEEETQSHKKQKLDENLLSNTEENVFKPIESDPGGVFCNLTLPNSINPSLSVSPTAAFLSSFPIVAPNRPEADDEVSDRKSDEGKDSKTSDMHPVEEKEKNVNDTSKEKINLNVSKDLPKESAGDAPQIQMEVSKEKVNVTSSEQIKFLSDSNFTTSSIHSNSNKNAVAQQQLAQCKSWEQFHHETSETFYITPENVGHINNSETEVNVINAPTVSYPIRNENSSYKNYCNSANLKTNMNLQNPLNEQVALENNHYDYLQKGNYMSKVPAYNDRSLPGKSCSNSGSMGESYGLSKSQSSNYQIDSGPNYQLLPAKDVPQVQRNSRTVNWMTEPDVSNRPVYVAQNDKMISSKVPSFTQSDNFYVNNHNAKISNECSGHFMVGDQNKTNYQKNEFYGKEQRCKGLEKRNDNKCYVRTPQNYNIFDYNYPVNCYGDDNISKYCQNQSYGGKIKKTVPQPKKKSDVHQVNSELPAESINSKRPPDQIITNLDFNSVANQECFSWMPGKNVEWLPSKSFGLDTNLVVPSTLPTLVGDLALGTTSTNDNNQKSVNTKGYQPNLKSNIGEVNKDYVDISLGATPAIPKPMESADTSKQYFEPFANLSKNIFDVTNSNMNSSQTSKNDYDKVNFVGNNSNETIVLKNIFELPVSKSSNNEFSRNKQRTINQSQNTFLSVSQLVEPSSFEGNSMKTDSQEPVSKADPYAQNYPSCNNQKSYKSKARSSHCKFNDRKYQGYKNTSSSYTAEALIRSNSNVNFQPNEFPADINTNFFNSKTNQKPDQFSTNNKIDFEINMKSDFSATAGQNIYSDFNFSSPVPNFTIGPTVGTDFGNHDTGGNFSAQNNSFFGDFITPEYPLSENVSNPLLLPQCSIALQNPFVIEKRNASGEKNKNNSKQWSTSRNRKNYDCTKTSLNEFPITPSGAIFTTSSITCPTIFTTSACQNLLSVPTQSIPISFSSPSFTTSSITFPPLSSSTNNNYQRLPNSSQNSTSTSFLSSNTMFTTCTSKPLPSSHGCYPSNPLTRVTNPVVSSSFHVGNVQLPTASQSSIPFFSLSNPIIPSSAPTSSSNSLANFNLSTIFPEINKKGNYHYS